MGKYTYILVQQNTTNWEKFAEFSAFPVLKSNNDVAVDLAPSVARTPLHLI